MSNEAAGPMGEAIRSMPVGVGERCRRAGVEAIVSLRLANFSYSDMSRDG